jgi:hypothetical protein
MIAPSLTSSLGQQLIASAILAPSSHNTQPWRFELAGDRILLLADRTRALPVNDPHDRELTISCGAALFNLEIAARQHGFAPELALLPDPQAPDLLARISLTPGSAGDPLFEAIAQRRTTRERFADQPLPEQLGARLHQVVEGHGFAAHELTGAARTPLAELVAEGDRRQFGDPRWRRELARWLRPRSRGDGLVVSRPLGFVTRAVVTALDLGKGTASKDHALLLDAPLVLVLASSRDDPQTWLEVGRALQHLLLIAAREQVMAGYLNQPCQIDDLRERLGLLLPEPRVPQLIIRLGRLRESMRPAPRRPLADVLIARGHESAVD